MKSANNHSSEFIIKTLKDEPIDDAKLLGVKETANTLYSFLVSDTLISPLVIAVNGEWGSGKTSLINTVKRRLEEDRQTVVFFDAWKYEYSDPAAALFYTIAKRLELTKQDFKHTAVNLGKLALDVFARRYTGISIEEMKEHFELGVTSIETLSEELQNMAAKALGNKKVMVFIDDLDRCGLDNVLEILDTLKLFLGITNFVFIVAVDMSKIKLAWSYKYGKIEELAAEGLKYLEKIFQIEVRIPTPSPEQIREYVHYLNPNLSDEILALIVLIKVRNPRRIIRLLNLASLRANVGEKQRSKLPIALLWSSFELLIGKEQAATFYDQVGSSEGYYDFLNKINSLQLERSLSLDEIVFKHESALSDIIDNIFKSLPEDNRYTAYESIIVKNKGQHVITYHTVVVGFMALSAKILIQLNEDKSKLINIINEIVSFSKET